MLYFPAAIFVAVHRKRTAQTARHFYNRATGKPYLPVPELQPQISFNL